MFSRDYFLFKACSCIDEGNILFLKKSNTIFTYGFVFKNLYVFLCFAERAGPCILLQKDTVCVRKNFQRCCFIPFHFFANVGRDDKAPQGIRLSNYAHCFHVFLRPFLFLGHKKSVPPCRGTPKNVVTLTL